MKQSQAAVASSLPPGTRIQAIDMLRGLVIVIMALDHVRDYFHDSGSQYDPLDPNFTTPLLYITRWITNFCAPTFVFLAGVSIWLQAVKGKDTAQLSRFLLSRGLWILILELTVISFGWSFSIPYLPLLQVMWAIGWSMVALSALVWLPRQLVLGIGIAIIACHNLLDPIKSQQLGGFALLWKFLHEQGLILSGGLPAAYAAYPLLPWIGVMALGYGLGAVFLSPKRDRILIQLGLALITIFLILRCTNGYGDSLPWTVQADWGKTAMLFFHVQKYPPSLMFVCATLGPVLLLIPVLERSKGPVVEFFRTFGAVPLMAYLSHIYVLHALALAAHFAAGHNVDGMFNTIYKFFLRPEAFAGTGFPLWVTYLAWIVVVALIYPLCRWWGAFKRRRRDWWLSYL